MSFSVSTYRLLPYYLSLGYLLFIVSGCSPQKLSPDDDLSLSFTYAIVPESDGLVTFESDPTSYQLTWNFGDQSAPVHSSEATVSHLYQQNGTYLVTMSYQINGKQFSKEATVIVDNRLARTFEDLPAGERDTLRVLCVVTHESYKELFKEPKTYQITPYENQVFIQFLQRTQPDRPKELDRLVFQKIAYVLSPEEMTRFNQSNDPDAFLNLLLSRPEDPLHQKILQKKKYEAVSRVVFYMKDPIINGYAKYGIGGYSVYEGGYFVLFSAGSYVHELGHSLGFDHDNLRDCQYFPIMVGTGTKTSGACNSLWMEKPEFQVAGVTTNLIRLRSPNYYEHAVPAEYRNLFPDHTELGNLQMTYLSTTPYYREGISLKQTLSDAFIDQFNIRKKPGAVTHLYLNPDFTKAESSRTGPDASRMVRCFPTGGN